MVIYIVCMEIDIFSIDKKIRDIWTKNHDKIIEYVIDSLKLNNANLALENKMLHESLENYKRLYYDLVNKDMKDD